MKSVCNKKFEIRGMEMSRLLRLFAFALFLPIGNMRGGPGLRCCAVLCFLHYFGYPAYFVYLKYGERLRFLKPLYARLR
ncbi:MAG: hypothetical protein CSA20_02365 [Deltaproteobacteria bacterium]|nr:MAG: hypothetical protein CSB23_02035 [Deltaproteobacteria bacterium]PIE73578.1 MAG: hypothetical protein CSA20_02365 [Deltaproteobacteria bacterium]